MDFLATIKAPSPVFPNDGNAIISVGADAPVAEAFQVLIKNNILAAPVFDYATNKYCCMFSIRDVVYHALRVLGEKFENEDMPSITFLTEKEHFRNYKVKDIISQKETLAEVGTDITVDKVVELMVKSNAHRMVSLNPDGSLNNIITQSRLLECLVQLFTVSPSLGKLGNQTLQDLGIAQKDELITVREGDKAVDAFKIMCDKNISGLPVVSNDGTLVGNISESDLRVIKNNAQYLKMLYLPVNEYLEAMKTHLNTGAKGTVRPLVKCEMLDTYRTVVDRIVENKIHRCYVVDSNNKLVGAISLHDLLAALVKHAPNPSAP